jgi:hypothetical protein
MFNSIIIALGLTIIWTDKSYFKNRYPELYWVFENKLKQYENN